MTCYFPPVGWYSQDVNPKTGKRPIVFKKAEAHSPTPVRLQCGQCIGCLKARAQEWAIRIAHEKRMHGASAFVTLTYSPANLPANATLEKSDLQKFMKRLRKARPQGLRFFACGEYGETTGRPHYHVLLLNTDFPDRIYHKNSAAGQRLYTSPELGRLWPFGDHYIGEVSNRSASYVARYVTKKIHKKLRPGVQPEFQVMSRRPGLGLGWFYKYGVESYYHDDCVIDARKVRLPRYYDSKLEVTNPERLQELKLIRRRKMLTPSARADNTKQRRLVRERFEHLKAERFKRDQL